MRSLKILVCPHHAGRIVFVAYKMEDQFVLAKLVT